MKLTIEQEAEGASCWFYSYHSDTWEACGMFPSVAEAIDLLSLYMGKGDAIRVYREYENSQSYTDIVRLSGRSELAQLIHDPEHF